MIVPENVKWATIAQPPKAEWSFQLCKGSEVKFLVSTAPNRFHRLTQWLLLGIHWERL